MSDKILQIGYMLTFIGLFGECLVFALIGSRKIALCCKYKIVISKGYRIRWISTVATPNIFLYIAGMTLLFLEDGSDPMIVLVLSVISFYVLNIYLSYLYMSIVLKRYFGFKNFHTFVVYMQKREKIKGGEE